MSRTAPVDAKVALAPWARSAYHVARTRLEGSGDVAVNLKSTVKVEPTPAQ
jgi:hypothetical protein